MLTERRKRLEERGKDFLTERTKITKAGGLRGGRGTVFGIFEQEGAEGTERWHWRVQSLKCRVQNGPMRRGMAAKENKERSDLKFEDLRFELAENRGLGKRMRVGRGLRGGAWMRRLGHGSEGEKCSGDRSSGGSDYRRVGRGGGFDQRRSVGDSIVRPEDAGSSES